jgi:hypothetical protein
LPDPGWHRDNGWTDGQAGYELEKFRDYWCAKARDAAKLDWQATWRNWLRKAAESGHGPRTTPGEPWQAPVSTTSQRVSAALRLAERFEAEGQ